MGTASVVLMFRGLGPLDEAMGVLEKETVVPAADEPAEAEPSLLKEANSVSADALGFDAAAVFGTCNWEQS